MFTFIELEPFARARTQLLNDDEFARLQLYLIAQPDAGDVIPGTDGCIKLRWALAGRGKRGGARIVYFLRLGTDEIVRSRCTRKMCATTLNRNFCET